ncbi:hypothetical protein LL037_13470 [Clostridium estertheticum]|uniref:hypothetical protein n=1 Tax=Clostridium estertheticum TaxID=238834 RepID=UPI001C0DBC7C|nr:hypothetical protein [Clostridium estertheticum]MBU3201448.1 hypothetical protein [Clostridium estertheticum]WAG63499.1 hypothetical protein LL037_13470 [Clostridium estertheticum]
MLKDLNLLNVHFDLDNQCTIFIMYQIKNTFKCTIRKKALVKTTISVYISPVYAVF